MTYSNQQGQQEHSTDWSVVKSHQAWSFAGDATVLAIYTLRRRRRWWYHYTSATM